MAGTCLHIFVCVKLLGMPAVLSLKYDLVLILIQVKLAVSLFDCGVHTVVIVAGYKRRS